MNNLRELIALGFDPMVALLVAAIIVMGGAVVSVIGVVVFFYKKNSRDREKWHGETRKRLDKAERQIAASDRKHGICDVERQKMKRQITGMQGQIRIMHACPEHECPMKDILARFQAEREAQRLAENK